MREDDKQLLGWIAAASKALRKTQTRNLRVDALDTPLLLAHTWHLVAGYPAATIDKRKQYLHRILVGVSGAHVDHINGDKCDNRRCNLRTATRAQNMRNCKPRRTGALRGVSQAGTRWSARISINNRKVHLGTFDSEIEAHEAYLRAAKSDSGVFTRED